MLVQDFKDFCEQKNSLFEIIWTWCDSDVFIRNWWALKTDLVKYYYKWRTPDTIKKYYDIQSELARKIWETAVVIQTTLGITINCCIKVLELPNSIIYEYWERVFTTPIYIPWETLAKSSFVPQWRVQERVSSIIANHIGTPIRIDPRNMKVVWNRDESLSITITDIASNIRHFINHYSNL